MLKRCTFLSFERGALRIDVPRFSPHRHGVETPTDDDFMLHIDAPNTVRMTPFVRLLIPLPPGLTPNAGDLAPTATSGVDIWDDYAWDDYSAGEDSDTYMEESGEWW